MTNSSLTLKDFLEPTAPIEITTNWQSLKTLLESRRSSPLVVVNQKRSPIGMIHLGPFLEHLCQQLPQKDTLSPQDLTAWLEPITILPAHLTLKRFSNYLVTHLQGLKPHHGCALVDRHGQFLGLINAGNLIKLLALETSSQRNFWKILEQLPLPAMVKTLGGKTLTRNLNWRQKIGEFVPVILPAESSVGASVISLDQLQQLLPELLEESSAAIVCSNLQPENPYQFYQFLLPLPEQSELTYLILAKDIVEEEIPKELMIKSENLLTSNSLNSSLLTCISHDLKSPLTSILGLSSLLKTQKLGELNDKQSHYIDLIYQSGRQMMTLVNELFDLTRLENGQIHLKLELLSLAEISQEIANLIADKLRENNLKLQIELAPNLGLIKADRIRLMQLLMHLVEESIKGSDGQEILKLKINYWGKWLALTINCNAQEINYNYCNFSFLFLQKLAAAQGGDLSITKRKPTGINLTVLLPLTAPEKEEENASNQKLILLVESPDNQLQQLNDWLNDFGYRVVIAQTGVEGLEKARRLQPNGIFLHPSSAVLSGWDVLSILKSDVKTAKIPVVITANFCLPEIVKIPGVSACLNLPTNQSSVAEVLLKIESKNLTIPKNLTILVLCSEGERSQENSINLSWLSADFDSQLIKKILEADDLEQAELIAQVWQVDAIIFSGETCSNPSQELLKIKESDILRGIPLITIGDRTTKAANQVKGLQVFPCLVAAEKQNYKQVLQVIEIAVGIKSA